MAIDILIVESDFFVEFDFRIPMVSFGNTTQLHFFISGTLITDDVQALVQQFESNG